MKPRRRLGAQKRVPEPKNALYSKLGEHKLGMRTRPLLLEIFRLGYRLSRRLFELVLLLARSEQRKEVEILLLRHSNLSFRHPQGGYPTDG
jgi:hypothetical protein